MAAGRPGRHRGVAVGADAGEVLGGGRENLGKGQVRDGLGTGVGGRGGIDRVARPGPQARLGRPVRHDRSAAARIAASSGLCSS